MAGDKLEGIQRHIEKSCRFTGDMFMAYTMKAIPANSVLVIQTIGQSVKKGVFRNRGMEGCVKDRHLKRTGKVPFAGFYAFEVMRIVQWCQGRAFFDDFFYTVFNDHRVGYFFSTMHNPVTDGSNIFFTVYDAISIISENTGNNADGFNGVRNPHPPF
jgi:hypothetical protein